ncbi:MAG: insulinase family protein [Flavobacteriales bacterium]|nr:insulinase family protein [Flavobacteriales bacterium]
MMVDRSLTPGFEEVQNVNLLDYDLRQLSCGVPVYVFNAGSQDVVSLEILFDAGSWNQSKPFIASSTSALLKEGTAKYSSLQMNEAIDFYGSFLQTDMSKDSASIALYALNKQLDHVLPYLTEVLLNPVFLESELKTHLARVEQQFVVNQQKNSTIARREFLNVLYGDNHPYGKKAEREYFKQVERDDLAAFWSKSYTAKNCKVFLSGKITDEVFQAIDNAVLFPISGIETVNQKYSVQSSKQIKHYTKKIDSVQSAIRIGERVIGKSHPDFAKLQVVNTILGGYFGSRLMSNIREDKGFTYGIGSFIAPMAHDCYFGISTEVGIDVTQKAIDEIYKELEILRTELVSEGELRLVKSYLMGELLKSVDGPFAVAERWKGMILFGLDKSYFNGLIQTITTITPQEVLEIAVKYLDISDLYEVVVGVK